MGKQGPSFPAEVCLRIGVSGLAWLALGVTLACGIDERNVLAAAEPPADAGTESSIEALAVCRAGAVTAGAVTAGVVTTAVCEDPWRYRRWASCSLSDAGPVTPATCSSTPACMTWNTCEDWSFGAGAPATQVETFQHQVTTCRDPVCFNACDEEATTIQAAEDALRDRVPAPYRDQVLIVQQKEDAPTPPRPYSPGFLEDDKFIVTRECNVTFEVPTPASGQGLVCGCAVFECRSPGCGAEPNDLLSPSGLTLAAVLAQEPSVADTPAPACSSCDAPPVATPGASQPL